jgi:hypothetical protein
MEFFLGHAHTVRARTSLSRGNDPGFSSTEQNLQEAGAPAAALQTAQLLLAM